MNYFKHPLAANNSAMSHTDQIGTKFLLFDHLKGSKLAHSAGDVRTFIIIDILKYTSASSI